MDRSDIRDAITLFQYSRTAQRGGRAAEVVRALWRLEATNEIGFADRGAANHEGSWKARRPGFDLRVNINYIKTIPRPDQLGVLSLLLVHEGTHAALKWTRLLEEMGEVLAPLAFHNFIGNGSSALIRRSALSHTKGYDSSLRARSGQGCEDWKLYFEIAERYQFGLVPEPLTGYRDLPDNMSSDMVRMLRSFDLVAAEMLERYPQHRGDVMEGRAWFLEWSLLTAAERGDLRTWLKLYLVRLRQTASGAFALLLLKSPRAVLRGLRLRMVGRPRRRRDYTPIRFPIGAYEAGHG